MVMNGEAFIRRSFAIICILSAICMVGYWFKKFAVEDRDVGLVDYESFEESENSPFPVISFCFRNIFMPKRVSNINNKISISEYVQYLKGELYDDGYENIDYWNVTIDLENYFLGAEVEWANETLTHNDTLTFIHNVNFNGIDGISGEFQKCFQVSSNINQHRYVKKFKIFYNKQAHLKDIEMDSYEVWFNIHHAEQFLLAPNDPNLFIVKKGASRSHGIWIQDVEFLRSRNSYSRTCTKKGSYDTMVAREHIIQKGCRPPYLRPYKEIPLCNTSEGMKNATYAFNEVRKKYLPIACERMSKIQLYITKYYYTSNDMAWTFSITYPEYFKVISQTKEVDIHTLIGNIGGYVGLFLGKSNFLDMSVRTNDYKSLNKATW